MKDDYETPHLVDPVIRGILREIIEVEFGAAQHVADDISFRILLGMKQRKLLVTQQRVYVMPMTQEERWLKITREAIEWINGPSSPLNRPELR